MDGKISALNKKHVETAVHAAQIVFESVERPTQPDMEAVELLFREGVARVRTLAS